MAKGLPYFKFYSSEWSDGDITLLSYKIQGVFINICSYYWSRECNLEYKKFQKRFKNSKSEIKTLLDDEILFIENGYLRISFLDQQWHDRGAIIEKNRANGAKGGRPKKNPNETQTKPNGLFLANPNESHIDKTREEEITQPSVLTFKHFWNIYDKKTSRAKAEKKYDKIKEADRQIIKDTLPGYIESTPDKKFRKDVCTYLNNESWNDEIIATSDNAQNEDYEGSYIDDSHLYI